MCDGPERSMDGNEGQNLANGEIIKDILFQDWIASCCVLDAWQRGLYEWDGFSLSKFGSFFIQLYRDKC